MEGEGTWTDDKERAASIIKQMREGGLLRDGSSARLAMPMTAEAETATSQPLFSSADRIPSWHTPDAIVRVPSGTARPSACVMSSDSYVVSDEQSQRRLSMDSSPAASNIANGIATTCSTTSNPSTGIDGELYADSCDSNADAGTLSEQPPIGAQTDKEHVFVWVDIDVVLLDVLEDIEVMRALDKRNKGDFEGIPAWLLEGLKPLKGPVDWLVKVKVPEGVKYGQRLALVCNGVKVKTTYYGQRSDGGRAVFAVQEREVKPSIGRRITKSLASAMRRRSTT